MYKVIYNNSKGRYFHIRITFLFYGNCEIRPYYSKIYLLNNTY